MKNKAYVNNIILKWARETAKMNLSVAAKKVGVSESKLLSWENGDLYPTIAQAKKLAITYRRPFAILFFQNIPSDFQPLKDYRKSNSEELTTASLFMIREIQQKQIWIHDWMMNNNKNPLTFVGSCSANDSPKIVAKKIINTFSLNKIRSEKCPSLKKYIDTLELFGVFVSRSSYYHTRLSLNPEEFLGFAISDIYAPYIFINTRNNWKKQQTFTLFHELAHLFIGNSSISNNIDEISVDTSDFDDVEIFCNKVAANVLMPEDELLEFNRTAFSTEEDMIRIAKQFGVSSFALMIRLYDLNIITKNMYHQFSKQLKNSFKEKQEELNNRISSDSGPNPLRLRVNRNSRNFSAIIYDAFGEGYISSSVASSLLNVKVNHFGKLQEYI